MRLVHKDWNLIILQYKMQTLLINSLLYRSGMREGRSDLNVSIT